MSFKEGDYVNVKKGNMNFVGKITELIELAIASDETLEKIGFEPDEDMPFIINELGSFAYKVIYEPPYKLYRFKHDDYVQWANENDIDLRRYPYLYTLKMSNIQNKLKSHEFIKKHHTIEEIKEEYLFINQISKYNRTEGGKYKKTRRNKKRHNKTKKNLQKKNFKK
jgi:hypothetical protein